MRTLRFGLRAVGVAGMLLLAVPIVQAQPIADHLKCYKIHGSQVRTTYTADLGGLVAEPGCTIIVPAVMMCVPSTKTNVAPVPPGGGGTGTPNRFFCYRVRCPRPVSTLPTVTGQDQFGTHVVLPSTAKLLCAPLAPETCATSNAPQCGGPCPNPGDVCSDVNGLGCQCVTGTVPCNPSLPLDVCGTGDCPPGQTCQASLEGCTCF
jgi:hypothetical protein